MVGIARLSVSGLLMMFLAKVIQVGERGHRLSERRSPFLGEEFALAVKDANPRISK